MKTKKILIPTALLSIGVLVAGCTGVGASASDTDTTGSGAESMQTTVSSSNADLSTESVLAENADYQALSPDDWSDTDLVDIDLSGTTATSTDDAVKAADGVVTITAGGVYRLSGDLEGSVVVDAAEDAQVVLILDGASIDNADGPAIEVRLAGAVAIHLADGSKNEVSDTDTYDEDADNNAAIFSTADLTISGTGSLTVAGNGGRGVASDGDLVVLDGTITVTAAEDALSGKDALVVEDGDFTLTSANADGLKSDGDDEADEIDWTIGYIWVTGGDIDITAGDDGLQAFTDTVISGGTITADVVDDGVKGEVIVAIDGNETTVEVVASTEGIEAANVGIGGGVIDVTASDDAVNASGNAELQALIEGVEYVDDGTDEFMDTGERLEITGGTLTVDAEGDGLDSNGSLTITGGNTIVYGPTTGGNGSLDADGAITVEGGTVLALGPGDMEQTPSTGEQGWVLLTAELTAGQTAELVDESGEVIAEFTAAKDATSIIFSSADIETGATYTVTSNGDTLGTAVAGEGGTGGMGDPGGSAPGGMGRPGEMGGGSPSGGEGGPGMDEGGPMNSDTDTNDTQTPGT